MANLVHGLKRNSAMIRILGRFLFLVMLIGCTDEFKESGVVFVLDDRVYKECYVKVISGKKDGLMSCYQNNIKVAAINWDKDVLNGAYNLYYSTGEDSLRGNMLNEKFVGEYYEYYKSGLVKRYSFFDSVRDVELYKKILNEDGTVKKGFIPVSVKMLESFSNLDSTVYNVELEHTMFDSVHIAILLDLDDKSIAKYEDTLGIVARRSVDLKLSNKHFIGRTAIDGELYELNVDGAVMGIKEFSLLAPTN